VQHNEIIGWHIQKINESFIVFKEIHMTLDKFKNFAL